MERHTLDDVQHRFLLLVAILVVSIAAPLAAQGVEEPGLAPAIGPWRSAPRGFLTTITPGDASLNIEGVASDPDSAQAISYEILIDGMTVAVGATPRPSGFGRAVTFSEVVRIAPGIHRVCLRLTDGPLTRTVHCRRAVTAPPVTVDQETLDAAKGVAISGSGVVLPILGGTEGNWTVETPCGATARLANATVIERARVVIDPGHGGSESGAVGGGLLEKDVNLDVAKVVVNKFEELGISAILTRSEDYRLPIRTRANIATSVAPDVFLSLHHNGGATQRSSGPGTEIFYSEARPGSERLARVLYEELNAAAAQFDAQWVATVNEGASMRLRDDGKDLYGVHRYSPEIDSVITEFLYLSNGSEAALMRRPEVIEAEAQAIVDGILRWWFTQDEGTEKGRVFTDSSSTGTGGFDGCVDPELEIENVRAAIRREDVLAEAASQTTEQQPPVSLLPVLTLGADPSVDS